MIGERATAIGEITREAEKCRARFTELERQKKEIELELPQVKTNLDALEKTLAILQPTREDAVKVKETSAVSTAPPFEDDPASILKEGSMTHIGYLVLKEGGTPLGWSDFFTQAETKKPGLDKNSFQSGIYRLLKVKKVFKKYDGKIGLREWRNRL